MLPFAILPAIDGLRRDGEEPTAADRRGARTRYGGVHLQRRAPHTADDAGTAPWVAVAPGVGQGSGDGGGDGRDTPGHCLFELAAGAAATVGVAAAAARGFTFALPFAMLAAVDAIRCYEPWPDHIHKRAAITLLAIVTLWMVVGGGWLVPTMNHRWRNAVDSANAGQPVAPLAGVEDLSTYELLTLADHVHPLTAVVRPGERGREIENRLSFALLPILLLWIRWRSLDAGSTGWFVPLPLSVIGAMAMAGVIFSRALMTPFARRRRPGNTSASR